MYRSVRENQRGAVWLADNIGSIATSGGKAGQGYQCILSFHPINYAIDSMSSNSMKSSNPHSGIHQENYVKTIDTSGNNPGCNQGGNMIVYALQGNMIGRNDENGPQGKGYKEDEMYTLNTIDRHAIVQPVKLRVRKITEREALKLMGLPDDWFDGAYLPKTKQYEKCGNGLVTGKGSYWWYMWQNIYKLLGKEKPTLFSQFNGVGMTEYITEDIGFQTVYTSEIDEAANKAYINLQRTGKMAGEEGESGLIWQTIRTAKEMLEATNGRYPQVIATENVAGEVSHKDFLTKFLIALDRLGYAIDIQLHNALDYNVAQSRERVSIVAIKKTLPHDNNFEEHRHKRVQKVLKEINADIELFSGIATFPHETQQNHLCDFIDDDVSEEYDLSPKACIGVMRRSYQRGKAIPAILAYALMVQSGDLYYEKEYESEKGAVNGNEFRAWYADIIDKGFEKMELPVCLDNNITDSRISIKKDNVCGSIQAHWGTGGNNTALILDKGNQCFGVVGSTQDNAYVGDGSKCCTLNEAMGKGGGHIPVVGVINDTGGGIR